MGLFNRTKRPQVHVVRVGEERMEEAKVIEALQTLGDNHPAWRAVLQVLTDNLAEARAQVGHIELAEKHGALAHIAGGCAWLEFAILQLQALKAGTGKEHEGAAT